MNLRLRPHWAHQLEIGAVGISRLGARLLELLGEIRDGQLLALASRRTAFELVRGEHLDVFDERRLNDARGRRRRRGRSGARRRLVSSAGNREDREVTIQPGYAIDSMGREIVLTEPLVLQVPPVASDA